MSMSIYISHTILCRYDVFKDPMPPVTKAEQLSAKDARKRRLYAYGWVLAFVLAWGCFGLKWLSEGSTCAATAPMVRSV